MERKYFGYMPNDFINGEDVCVSLWTAGCPHKCKGCHNQEMWDRNGGKDVPYDIKGRIVKAICANGITRNFSILGGEPLMEENLEFVEDVVTAVRTAYPHIKIYIWSGYTFDELIKMKNDKINHILSMCDYLIDGRYVEELRDTTLKLRGSSNQQIINLRESGE